jgi:hypothetical protein
LALFIIANIVFVVQSRKNITVSQMRSIDPVPAQASVSTEDSTCTVIGGVRVTQLTSTYKTSLTVDQLTDGYKTSTAKDWIPVGGAPATPGTRHLAYQRKYKDEYVALEVFIPENPQIFADGTHEYRATMQAPSLKAFCGPH